MSNPWENEPLSPKGKEGDQSPESFRVPIETISDDDAFREEGIIRRHRSDQFRNLSDSLNSPLFSKIENKIFKKALFIIAGGSAISLVAILVGLTSINSLWLIPGTLVSIAGIVWFRLIMKKVLELRRVRFKRKAQKIAEEARRDLEGI